MGKMSGDNVVRPVYANFVSFSFTLINFNIDIIQIMIWIKVNVDIFKVPVSWCVVKVRCGAWLR